MWWTSNKARGQVWQPRETPLILESFLILILINQPKKTNLTLMVSEITKKKIKSIKQALEHNLFF